MLRILYATYPSPETFLEHITFQRDASLLGVATKSTYQVDEELILEIGFPGLLNRILVRASSAAVDHDDDDIRWFRIDESEEMQLDFLIAIAAGRADASVKRRHRRFPLRMDARVKIDGEEQRAQTADMATSGVSLETDEPLPDGARVAVILNPGDGSEEIELVGTVRWNRPGDDESAEVGIEFDKGNTEDAKRLRHLIRGVKLSGELHSKG